ncbi:Transmembrane protease serine 9 [Coemansia sp. RSA 2522]|nr:hypothetical protein J3F81_001590 [Coemansia sp. RSA 371]KAJ2434761.1 Transmembrane protease serine 9 [Coemansia sp. RSA 2522]
MFNNQQTLCQATILSSTAAVLAASCFDYDENKQADVSQYSLTVQAGEAAEVLQAQISNITPHPNYDPVTFANNIAVIRFSEVTTTLTYMIDNQPFLWESFLHVQFSLTADLAQWNVPQMEDVSLGDQNECGASSTLFQAYPSDYICSVGKVMSTYDNGCELPYQFILGHFEVGTGMIGFYSHSSLEENTSFCDNNQIYNYYIIIAHYIPWINLLIDPDVYAGNRRSAAPDEVTESYTMMSPVTGSSNGRTIHSLYKFANVLPVIEAVPAIPAEVQINTITETETETETKTTTSISITTEEPNTVTVTDTIINTEQVTNIVSTTQDITTTSDRTTTVSETVTATATATTTETVTATLLQTLSETQTNIQSDTLIQSQTMSLLITTTAVSMSECPVVTCDTPDVSRLTVTETEKGTTVEIETVTVTELDNMTVDNHEFSAVVVTVTISQPPETVTQTVASDQSVDPITMTSISTEILVVSETETLDGSVESIFATVTTEIKPSSSLPAEPEKSDALPPWMIALIVVIIVVVLLIMGLFIYLYFRWKKKQRELYLASLVTQTDYPQEYINPQYMSKGYDGYDIPGSYNLPEERQSRYNSKGSYVGYT